MRKKAPFASALLSYNTDKADKVPKDWKTRTDVEKELRVSRGHAGELLRRLQRSGKCETKKFRIVSGGVTRSIPHYRVTL